MLEKALRHQMPNKSGEPAAAPAEIQLDPDSLVLSSRENPDAEKPVKDERCDLLLQEYRMCSRAVLQRSAPTHGSGQA